MTTWEELRERLVELRTLAPSPLLGYPSLEADVPPGRPVHVWLQPWAESVAAAQHADFADQVLLDVGYLRYPGRRPRPRVGEGERAPLIDEDTTAVLLPAPTVVSSGQTVRTELVLVNLGKDDLVLQTNGALTASVLDPASGDVVGGFAGAQTTPLVVFRVKPQEAAVIPLLIGTASNRPSLGYVVPPGVWAMEATLTLAAESSPPTAKTERYRTPALTLTVTERDASRP